MTAYKSRRFADIGHDGYGYIICQFKEVCDTIDTLNENFATINLSEASARSQSNTGSSLMVLKNVMIASIGVRETTMPHI